MLDPSLILCENCGYDIGSLEPRLADEPGLKCPECGKPIAESLPERRVGSAWQRLRGIGGWFAAIVLTIVRPRRVWRIVEADFASSRNLMEWNLAASSLGWALVAASGVQGPMLDVPTFPLFVLNAICAFFALNVLSLIEWLGIQLFARRRHWRVTGEVAWSVVAHASVGWLLGPIAALVALLIASEIRWNGWGAWRGGPPHGGVSYIALIFAVGAPIGLLAFETLVYLGFRAMRFANHPRESAP